MKKIIFLLAVLVFLTGCTIKNINDEDINSLIDSAVQEKNNDYTEIFSGYKLKIPQGMKIVGKNDYNLKLSYDENNYFLYIDIISKYHNKKITYKENNTSYLSKKISYNNNDGYVEINKTEDDRYIIRAEYNYAKIESIVSEDKIKISAYNMVKILSSIEYNDLIIETLIGENALSYEEEEFNFFDSTREEGYFMDYVEEYNEYETDVKDEDVIK
jgi:hypothetical protein